MEVEERAPRRKPLILVVVALETVLVVLNFVLMPTLEAQSVYGAAALTNSVLGGMSHSLYQGLTRQFRPAGIIKFHVWGVFLGVWAKFWTDQLAKKYPDAFRKVLFDQLIGNPCCVFAFTSFNAFWEGYNVDRYLQVNYLPSLKASIALWPLAATIQFTLIKPPNVFLYNSIVTFVWSLVLSLLAR